MHINSKLFIFLTFIISIGLIGCQAANKAASPNSTVEKAIENGKKAPADGDDHKSENNALAKDKDGNEAALKSTVVKKETKHKQEQKNTFTYKTYTNTRFGFTFEYPVSFYRSPAPTNNDGREFYNDDCSITASGSNINVSGKRETIKTYYKRALEHGPSPIAYKRLGRDWYVISYKNGSDTVYEKAIIGEGIISTLKITYPSSKQKHYEPMINRVSGTFKAGKSE